MTRIQNLYLKSMVIMLRKLDEEELVAWIRKWGRPEPRVWQPEAKLMLMHKMRVSDNIRERLTKEEVQLSRDWLAARGLHPFLRDLAGTPCPECGSTTGRITYSNCETCGVGTKQ